MTEQKANFVLSEQRDAVVTLTINRERRRNALTLATWQQLGSLVDKFASDSDCKVLIIRGAGIKAFASGSDIDELPKVYADPNISIDYDRTLLDVQNRICNCKKPVIAMIYGYCVGGGLGIATACDLRFAADNASFALPPARLGLINGVSSMRRLIQLIGLSPTRDMIYSARSVDAEEAMKMGLVNRVFNISELERQTSDYALQLVKNSQYSIQISKLLTEQIVNGKDQDDERYFSHVREAVRGEDFKEGFSAFKEKRKPKFPFR